MSAVRRPHSAAPGAPPARASRSGSWKGLLIALGVTVYLGATAAATVYGSDFFLSSSYVTKTDIYDLNPETSGVWTKAAIDAVKIGQKITV